MSLPEGGQALYEHGPIGRILDDGPPWRGFEDFVNIYNCEAFGLNEYVYEKYGDAMGFSAWFEGY